MSGSEAGGPAAAAASGSSSSAAASSSTAGGPGSATASASESEVTAVPEDFLVSGRTGRRNALGDILGECAETSTAGLAEALSQISTDDKAEPPHPEGASQAQSGS